jgi:hypothetical protein
MFTCAKILINNYSPKARLIIGNNSPRWIFPDNHTNNCFSIFTQVFYVIWHIIYFNFAYFFIRKLPQNCILKISVRKRTRKDTPLMLGGHADRYLHTPVSEHRPCSWVVKSENFTINNMAKNRTMINKTAPFRIWVDYFRLFYEYFEEKVRLFICLVWYNLVANFAREYESSHV